jgi:hypothetical protein
MVNVKLYGGLGNQMYQYAAGRVLSLKLNTGLYFDLDWFELIKGRADVVQYTYELDVFGINPKKLTLKDRASLTINEPTVFKEDGYGYQPKFENLTGNVILDGYWQSYKYFENYRPQLLEDFDFASPLSRHGKEKYELINSSQSISLHIRRVDYAKVKSINEVHGLMPISYYRNAVNDIKKSIKDPSLFIFSNDLEWCKQHINFNLPTIFMEDSTSGLEDMRLMAACKHNIIANSSFSWWAAWLNQNSNKLVYAPRNWFKSLDSNIDDRIPKNWKAI